MIQDNSEQLKQAMDVLSASAVIASIMTWIPPMAAILSLVWAGMRLYESYLNIKIKRKELNGN